MKLSKKVKEKLFEARKDLVETDGTIAYILNRYLDRELVEILTVEELRDEFVKVVQNHIDELRNPDDFTKMVAILNSITNEIKLLSTLGTYLTGQKVLKTEDLSINEKSPTIKQLEKELEKAKTRLAKDFKEGSLVSMKKAEIALQDVIEKVYPKTVWWEVTHYWDIFNAFMEGNDLDTVVKTIIEKAKAYEKNGDNDEKLAERKAMKEDSEETSMCHRLNNYVKKSKMEEKTVRANKKPLRESNKTEFLVCWEQVYEDTEFNSRYFNTLEEAEDFIEKYANYGNMRSWSLAEVDPANDYKIIKDYDIDECLTRKRKDLHENLKAIKKGNKSFSKKESDKLVENIQRYMFELNKYYELYTGKINNNKYAPTCLYEAKEEKQKEFQKYLESYIAKKDNNLRVLKEKVEESELDGYPVYNYTIIKK